MNQPEDAPPLFRSKDEFLAHGLSEVTIDNPRDCDICREPMKDTAMPLQTTPLPHDAVSSPSLPRILVQDQTGEHTPQINLQSPHDPETPVQITSCKHIFGSICLHTWFASSNSNRCPTCSQTLFPKKRFHLWLRVPTRMARIQFANMVEFRFNDIVTAELIRSQLMSEWTMDLIRETVVEGLVADGYDVTWEYLDIEGGSEEEDEDEELSTDEEEMTESDSDIEENAVRRFQEELTRRTAEYSDNEMSSDEEETSVNECITTDDDNVVDEMEQE